jgi:signal transduction histidine kinase
VKSGRSRIVVAVLALGAGAVIAILAALGVAVGGILAVALFLLVFGALLVGWVRLSSGLVSRVIARWPVSIRWKIVAALASIGGLVFFSTVVNFQAMDYMHQELHEIQELGLANPSLVLRAVDDLESTQHGAFFDLTPLFALAGALIALCLGAGIARSVLEAIRSMEQGMSRIAAGNFSEPIVVRNRDEFGALAGQINDAARELENAQEATVASERARALKERIAEVSLAQEEERRRISRELHDDLGPSLAAIVNRLRVARSAVRTSPGQVEADLGEIAEGLTGHIREIRELIHDLRPLALDQLGLAGALRQHVERFAREQGLQASFSSSGPCQSHPLTEMTVLRVAQEALSNVQQHAGAAHVQVGLRSAGGLLEVTVEDDGQGFDASAAAVGNGSRGFGLLSMQERAELVGGTVCITSEPRRGCRVTLQVPLQKVPDGIHTNPAR